MLVLHLVNRLLAAVLSLAVLAAAALLTVEVVRWALGEPPWLVPWADWGPQLTSLQAGDPEVLLASGAAAALGLLLLLFELAPRRPDALPSGRLGDGATAVTTRSGLRSAVDTAARGVPGVRSARVDIGRRLVDVTARTRARGEAGALEGRVRSAVERALDDLQLERPRRVRARVQEES